MAGYNLAQTCAGTPDGNVVQVYIGMQGYNLVQAYGGMPDSNLGQAIGTPADIVVLKRNISSYLNCHFLFLSKKVKVTLFTFTIPDNREYLLIDS